MSGYDVIGNVALVKFKRGMSLKEKKRFGVRFLKEHSSVHTVLEKRGKISGRLRTPKTRWVVGVNTREALYRENGCEFRLNVDSCYFSPRLSSERLEIAKLVKKGERVLVMFGGVAPFAIVIAKTKKPKEVISVELGKECNKYALENVKRNKLGDIVTCAQGDVRKIVPARQGTFDRIVMARPNLKDNFLDVAFSAVEKSGTIHYYGFYEEDKVDEMKRMIADEAKKAGKKVKILKVKKAGDIGFRKFRYRADIKVY